MRKIIICYATVIAFLSLAAVAVGQTVSAGIKIHERLLNSLIAASAATGSYTSTGTRFSIGCTVEIEITKSVSFLASRIPPSKRIQRVLVQFGDDGDGQVSGHFPIVKRRVGGSKTPALSRS